MKTIKQSILFLGLVCISFTSCNKDKENPVIEISTPAEHSDHKWGNAVHVTAKFTDDKGLKSYTVMVGDEMGMHDHQFNYMKTGDISDVSYEFHDHFMVPDSCEMMRWIHFTVTDEDGKSTEKKWMVHFEE